MNLANKLTMFRVILVPFFLIFMSISEIPARFLWALIIFIIASITDMLDGKIARKYNMVSDFGKFLDPLADKILVAAALICFVELGWTKAWIVAVIMMREFAVSGVRLVAVQSEKKTVISANIWGKLKTAFTMAAIIAILLMYILSDLGVICDIGAELPERFGFPILIISDVLMYITVALTLISGIKYIYDYRECIDPRK
ncbi:MAG: CDP-diacylglycerol--glycerol-3-phosphate 3-phosphatidyltransferase [Oscillospiraceae bacterium]|nr:CDP-diacylglycerol--glycerol-3-phosphate 3-phosphatidyltransferase [Oscillospiraceae bacterium]